MKFTKLRLTGFKSFVDPTELVMENGLTGVVGPNGCGKSNLVEALRWVMGENSAKRMRGGAMDDVIFSGTQNRTSRNLAEVLLTIDNTDRTAPPAFNEDEILEVSRRIERESGSTYRVNGKEVRQRDVQILFADLATGAHSPAMVNQGRIGSIINSKPTERRSLLEEAAGITGLHSRRHEAELRLRAAEANMERMDDVVQTLEAQLQAMKRQARQANRYSKVAGQIRQFEAIQFHLRYKKATARLAEAEQQLNAADRRVGELTSEVARGNSAYEEANLTLPGLREAEAGVAAKLHRFAVARDGLDAEERRLEQGIVALQAQLQQLDVDEERAKALAADAGGAIERLNLEKSELEVAREGEAAAQERAGEQVKLAMGAVGIQDQELEALTDRIAAEMARRDSLKKSIEDAERRLARLRERREAAHTQHQRLQEAVNQDRALQEAEGRLQAARQASETARQRLENAERERAEAEEAGSEAREAYQERQNIQTGLEAEAKAIGDLLDDGGSDLWPPLIDAVEVRPGYEAALAAALGDDIELPADEAAPAHWKNYPPLSDADGLPGGAVALADYVTAPAALARRLSHIGVIAVSEAGVAARELKPGQRLVTTEGDLYRWDGLTVQAGARTTTAARLEQRNRLNDIQAQLAANQSGLSAQKERFEAAQQATVRAAQSLKEAREDARRLDQDHNLARNAHGAAEREAAGRSSKLLALGEQLATLEADLGETEEALAVSQEEWAELPDLETARQQQGELRRKVSDLRSDLVEARSVQDNLRREAQARAARLAAIADEGAGWANRARNSGQQIEDLNGRRQIGRSELDELQRQPAALREQRGTLLEEIETAEGERKSSSEALALAENHSRELGQALRDAEATLAGAREDRVRFDTTLAQERERLGDLATAIREALECAPGGVLKAGGVDQDPDELPPIIEVDSRLERLKKERDRMGPVNLRAEQEARELGEQLEAMANERQDLEAAIARLRQGISSLNREGRERLLAAFKQVDEHFQDLFVRLFGGGKAHLALTESDDPLEAGLEIMASPPGKRLQTMSLLSGGEQALTALALLFAVFLTNPAPICVLDEVDAPLDDANVERFCNLVHEIGRIAGTRFLVITHHPYTMARMDRLFGVTMGERGISQLLSVDLARAERIRATG